MRAAFPALLVVVALLAFTACPKAGTDPQADTATAAPSPPWWLSIKDGKLHRGLDEAPIGLYASGDMNGERFAPGGNIEGAGPVGEKGTEAWLDLATGKVIKAGEPLPPPPYVAGNLTASGFSPSSRKIHY